MAGSTSPAPLFAGFLIASELPVISTQQVASRSFSRALKGLNRTATSTLSLPVPRDAIPELAGRQAPNATPDRLHLLARTGFCD